MLHIANGDSLMEIMNHSPLPGSVVPWRELLMDGPAPAGLNDVEWINVRADHLNRAFGIPRDEVGIMLRFQRDALDLTLTEDEVVLWFERDLICQVHLMYVLAHIARLKLPEPNVTLVMPEWIDGIDPLCGLGRVSTEQLMELFARRRPVTHEMLDQAEWAFDAYTSPDPMAMQRLAESGSMALPGLEDAFELHLARYPDLRTGIPLFQRAVLEELTAEPAEFAEFYARVNVKLHAYGITDWHVFNEARDLSTAREPLVTITGHEGEGSPHQTGRVQTSRLSITDAGSAALTGEFDHVTVNGVDGWLGGVHLCGHDIPWRWDAGTKRLVETGPEHSRRTAE